MSQDKWTERITKLLAKAQRAGTPEEADAFYTKAHELMIKWSIDEAMLQQTGSSTDELVRESYDMKRNGMFATFVDLWVAVAYNNDVKLLVRKPSQFHVPGVELIGWKSDIEKVKILWTSLLIQMQRERNMAMPGWIKELPNWSNSAEAGRFRKSFNVGYARRISQRLRETKDRVRGEATSASDGSGVALAIRDRSQAVDDFFNATPKGKGRAGNRKVDYDAMSTGSKAADRADIGQPRVGGNRGKLGH
jgi:hypothetical protein